LLWNNLLDGALILSGFGVVNIAVEFPKGNRGTEEAARDVVLRKQLVLASAECAEYGEDPGARCAESARSCGAGCFLGNIVRSGDNDKNLFVVDLTGLICGSSSEFSAVKSNLLDHLALCRPRDGPTSDGEEILVSADVIDVDARPGIGNLIPGFPCIFLARPVESAFGRIFSINSRESSSESEAEGDIEKDFCCVDCSLSERSVW
jgi:hypothetical protein